MCVVKVGLLRKYYGARSSDGPRRPRRPSAWVIVAVLATLSLGGVGVAIAHADGCPDPDPDPVARTPEEILEPGGNPIGEPSPGGDPGIRNVAGGRAKADEIFDELGQGGTPNTPETYPGRGVDVRDGRGWAGARDDASGNPVVDVNISGISVKKLHFPP